MNHVHKRLNEKSCSKGMKIRHVRLSKEVQFADALTFMAAGRGHVEEAYSGDIIGIHNHGTIRIGDTLTNLILGAIVVLQFEVVAQRLRDE